MTIHGPPKSTSYLNLKGCVKILLHFLRQIIDDDGNDRNDPRAFAAGSIPVEIYKEHMANIRHSVVSIPINT